MLKPSLGLVALFSSSLALAASPGTDFGVRTVPGVSGSQSVTSASLSWTPLRSSSATSLASAVAIASQWGRVTSTRRSVARIRAVGGVPNSYHLSGRAIDIARRPGVRHRDIEAAFRNAGYRLVESLDEGDHSHFAFGWGAAPPPRARQAPADGRTAASTAVASTETQWRIVLAPKSSR